MNAEKDSKRGREGVEKKRQKNREHEWKKKKMGEDEPNGLSYQVGIHTKCLPHSSLLSFQKKYLPTHLEKEQFISAKLEMGWRLKMGLSSP
ncbi:hypothetical protein CDAR_460911 [Caerostris darwini]|uniref:Uncharacterized protein n=1 Tax=Caerostris darwini TaxID=1538125 RepID=A0AAV4R8W5_9ARAC|nr:hypothetical protein CDAR_460911 [Caerostris darwini]